MWGGDDGQGPLIAGPADNAALMGAGVWNPPGTWNMPPRGAFPPVGAGGYPSAPVPQPPRKLWDPPVAAGGASGTPGPPAGWWPGQPGPPPTQWPTSMPPPPGQFGKPTSTAGGYGELGRGGGMQRGGHRPPPMGPGGMDQWSSAPTPAMLGGGNDWQTARAGSGADWGDSAAHTSMQWGAPTPAPPPMHTDLTGTAHWNQQRPPNASSVGQWGGAPTRSGGPMGGGAPPPQVPPPPGQHGHGHAGAHSDVNFAASGGRSAAGGSGPVVTTWDMNPQNPSMWVPPAPNEIKDDMMWHDPNPKTKKIQADKGTNVWGDPSQQGEIKRWKQPEDAPGAPASGWHQPTQSSSAVGAPASIGGATEPAATGWGEAGTPAVPPPMHWSAAPASVTHGESPQQQSTTWGQPPPAPSTQQSQHALKSSNSLEWPVTSSNSTNPMLSPTSQGGNMHRVAGVPAPPASVMHQRAPPPSFLMANSGGPQNVHRNMSQDIADAAVFPDSVVGGGEMDLMKPPIAPPGVNANGSSQQLQHLTNQIAEQLRVTVAKGLIDPFVLNQTLSKRTLLLLNNLLQRVPKLESAQLECERLMALAGDNPSPAHDAEALRLSREIEQLNAEIAEYSREINKNAAEAAGNNNGQQQTLPTDSMLRRWTQNDMNSTSAGVSLHSTAVDMWNSSVNSGVGSWPSTEQPKTDGVQEFVPGRQWMYQDPKSLENDPTATPGSSRPNFAALLGPAAASGGHTTPTKPDVSVAMSPVTDVWGKSGGQSQQVSRPASSLAQRTTQLSGMWVVLNGVQRADQVAMVAAQVGKLAIPMQVRAYACDTRHTNVQYVQGTMYLLKYTVESVSANAGAEQATLSRLIQELMPSGINVQPIKDMEVERLMMSAARAPPPPMGAWTLGAVGHTGDNVWSSSATDTPQPSAGLEPSF